MRMPTTVLLLIALAPAWLPAAPAVAAPPPPGIEVSGLAHKVLEGPDEDGDVTISIKVTVKSAAEADQRVEVWVQGLDQEGFEVFDARLSGEVKARQTRVLTDTQYVKEKLYKSIVKWQIED